MKIQWSRLALDRVIEIGTYIYKENPIAAEKWIRQIFSRVGQLERFPNSGQWIKETIRKDIREIVWGNYRIIYKTRRTLVSILTVRHTKQILPIEDIR